MSPSNEQNNKANAETIKEEQPEAEDTAETAEQTELVLEDISEDNEASHISPNENPQPVKAKKSISGFMWPVLCSVAVAGGLIITEDMWVKKTDNHLSAQMTELSQLAETNKTAIAQLVNQTREIEALKGQMAHLNSQDPKMLIGPLHDDVMALNGRVENDITVMNQSLGELKGEYARMNAQTDGIISQLQALSQMTADGASPEIQQRLDALEVARRQAVSALEGQVTALTQSLDEIKKQQPAFEVFDRRVNSLEGQVNSLSENINNLQNSIASGAVNNAQFLAVDNLARKIDLGQDYGDSLAALTPELAPQTAEAVTALQQNIGKIKPLYQLQADFNDVSRQIIISERKEQAEQSGNKKQSLLSNLNELVTISRTDGGTEGSADRLVYNLQNALQSGDLATVEQLLASASPAAQQAAEVWLNEVKAKIAAEAAITEIRNSLTGE